MTHDRRIPQTGTHEDQSGTGWGQMWTGSFVHLSHFHSTSKKSVPSVLPAASHPQTCPPEGHELILGQVGQVYQGYAHARAKSDFYVFTQNLSQNDLERHDTQTTPREGTVTQP